MYCYHTIQSMELDDFVIIENKCPTYNQRKVTKNGKINMIENYIDKLDVLTLNKGLFNFASKIIDGRSISTEATRKYEYIYIRVSDCEHTILELSSKFAKTTETEKMYFARKKRECLNECYHDVFDKVLKTYLDR